jgi:hypothetical protein
MPDSCVAEDSNASNAFISITLNGAGIVLGIAALIVSSRARKVVTREEESILSFASSHEKTLSIAAILIGVPTISLFYASGGSGSELGCVVALINSIGPFPAAFISAILAILSEIIEIYVNGFVTGWNDLRCYVTKEACKSVSTEAIASLFPFGAVWRARDCAITATTLVVVAFSGCVLKFYDPFLRIPTDASYDVTLGALAVSSVCCGPLLVFLAANELTNAVNNGIEESKVFNSQGDESSDDLYRNSFSEVEEHNSADVSLPLLQFQYDTQVYAVYRHWLVRTLPYIIANLVIFQVFLWVPVYGAEIASEHFGLDYSDSSLVAWSVVLVATAAVFIGRWLWIRRQ